MTAERWSTTGDNVKYSSISELSVRGQLRGNRQEGQLRGNRQEGRVRELRGQVEFRGHGYKDSGVMMR